MTISTVLVKPSSSANVTLGVTGLHPQSVANRLLAGFGCGFKEISPLTYEVEVTDSGAGAREISVLTVRGDESGNTEVTGLDCPLTRKVFGWFNRVIVPLVERIDNANY